MLITSKEYNEKLASGELYYDKRGRLHWKDKPAELKAKVKLKKGKVVKIDLFKKIVEKELNVICTTEYKFCEDRKWKFDYAIVDKMIAIEVEGGAFTQGRHTRGKGFINDMEKYNKATELGWTLIRVIPKELLTQGFTNLKKLLNG